jgi:hypothetical protein
MKWLATAAAVALSVAGLSAADISGPWTLAFELTANHQSYQGDCTFRHEGERVTGSCLAGFESLVAVTGSVKGRTVAFQFTTGPDQGATVSFSGELDADETSISGVLQFVDPNGGRGDGIFKATRPE